MRTWRETVIAARKRRGFTAEERTSAESWVTCAVGEHHAAMPTVVVYTAGHVLDYEEPGDGQLLDLGGDFYDAIFEDDFDAAEKLLDAIEDRVLQLKREGGSA